MMADFRSERMPSPEGEGNAKAALESGWETYYKANRVANRALFSAVPALKTMVRGYAASNFIDLFGFWLTWRLVGGFEGMQKSVGMSRTGIYRRIALFRQVFGEHPDVYEFPGITVDAATFNAEMAKRQQQKKDDAQS